LTILQGHAAFKGYGGKVDNPRRPTQNTGFPQPATTKAVVVEMPLLTPECIIFIYLFLKTPGRKDARTPEKPFFI